MSIDYLIKGGIVIDGSAGGSPEKMDIAVEGDMIKAVEKKGYTADSLEETSKYSVEKDSTENSFGSLKTPAPERGVTMKIHRDRCGRPLGNKTS